MKVLLPIFAGLALASCDSSATQADGTSSETQTSLQVLADRLTLLPGGFAPAARAMVMDRPAFLEGVRDSLYGISYLQSPETPSTVSLRKDVISYVPRSDSWRREYETRWLVYGCEILSGSVTVWNPDGTTTRTDEYRITYPNGAILEGAEHGDSYVVFEKRWVLRTASGPDWDWDVWENGRKIGIIRVDDSGVGEFLGMSHPHVYDLSGNEIQSRVPPDTSWKLQERLGLTVVSTRRLEDGTGQVRFRWNLLPSTFLAPQDTLEVLLEDSTGVRGFRLASPIRSLRGEDSVVVSQDALGTTALRKMTLTVRSPLVGEDNPVKVLNRFDATHRVANPFPR